MGTSPKKRAATKKKEVDKSKNTPKRATSTKRLTKKQIKQLRNSPTLKRKLDRATKIFNSPEFKEFIERNPLKRNERK